MTGRPAESPLRTAISLSLALGVGLSALLMAVGLVAGLVAGWETSLLGGHIGTRSATDLAGLLAGLAALQPLAITQLGVLVLLATPVLRIVTASIGFAIEGDRLYMIVSLIVLAILLLSIFIVR